ncbi:MAG: hypothetical protein VX627_03635 [Candidatus Thermoplasmatota archaeon]|nr:hypothetical protein [Candidatus Thermoplasmatota archaeon]
MAMSSDFLIAIIVSVLGIGISTWFIISRLRIKLAEVQKRQEEKA